MEHLLEITRLAAPRPGRKPPLLFLHGAFAGAWFWDYFLPRCADAGFDCHALSFRGHAGSGGHESLHSFGINHYVQDLSRAVSEFKQPPILIAHSMGGFVAQRYLASHDGNIAGIVLMASVAPYGSYLSGLHMGFAHPNLLFYLLRVHFDSIREPELSNLRNLLFSADISDDNLILFARRAQQESRRALTDMLMPKLWRIYAKPKIPTLILGAGEDKFIPFTDVLATAHAFGVQAEFIPHIGHAMAVDKDRDMVAIRLLSWLKDNYGHFSYKAESPDGKKLPVLPSRRSI